MFIYSRVIHFLRNVTIPVAGKYIGISIGNESNSCAPADEFLWDDDERLCKESRIETTVIHALCVRFHVTVDCPFSGPLEIEGFYR